VTRTQIGIEHGIEHVLGQLPFFRHFSERRLGRKLERKCVGNLFLIIPITRGYSKFLNVSGVEEGRQDLAGEVWRVLVFYICGFLGGLVDGFDG